MAAPQPQLIDKASQILADLGVVVRTHANDRRRPTATASAHQRPAVGGRRFFVLAGLAESTLAGGGPFAAVPTGPPRPRQVDTVLRVLDHRKSTEVRRRPRPSVDPDRAPCTLPPLAHVALDEGETVPAPGRPKLNGPGLEYFTFPYKGCRRPVGTSACSADKKMPHHPPAVHLPTSQRPIELTTAIPVKPRMDLHTRHPTNSVAWLV